MKHYDLYEHKIHCGAVSQELIEKIHQLCVYACVCERISLKVNASSHISKGLTFS